MVVVIGGLMTESSGNNRSAIPGLGDVPLAGALFRKGDQLSSKRELVILIKPTVIKMDSDWADDIAATSRRIQSMNARRPRHEARMSQPMYLQHFQLNEFPFGITPDTSFFFSSETSQEALNTLLVATRAGEGFIKITGEVGTGKTLLCRQLLLSVGSEFQTAYIPNPYLTPQGLLLELAEELGADTAALGEAAEMQRQHLLLKALNQRLLSLALENKRVLVCLDEVQAMPIETLEALRLLTNLETEKRKLVQVVIFGQPELDEKLNHPSIRQLKQRITFDYHLGPLMGAGAGALSGPQDGSGGL